MDTSHWISSSLLLLSVGFISNHAVEAGKVRDERVAFDPFDPNQIRLPESVDDECMKNFGGVNFLAWVVRIIIIDRTLDGKGKSYPHIIATGNIISENWVLTACVPFYVIIEKKMCNYLRVLPAVTQYTNEVPDPSIGKFPYADHNVLGCIVAYYLVKNIAYKTATGKTCNADRDDFPDGVVDNFLLFEMESPIIVGDFTIYPRMPFSYDFDRLVEKIDWFNTYRRSRCIIAKLNSTVQENLPNFRWSVHNKFDDEGFTYKTIPFRTLCVPTICEKNCEEIKKSSKCQWELNEQDECGEHSDCMAKCTEKLTPLLGTVMCLTRLHESKTKKPLPYSLAFDTNSEHVPYVQDNYDCIPRENARPIHILGIEYPPPIIIGAPVVCDGEAIAIVTRCERDFLVATTIVPIRHRLLKLFDTSYEKDLVYMNNVKIN